MQKTEFFVLRRKQMNLKRDYLIRFTVFKNLPEYIQNYEPYEKKPK